MTQLTNWILILAGHTLYNKSKRVQVKWSWSEFRQLWTNPNRKRPYSLDDPGWKIERN